MTLLLLQSGPGRAGAAGPAAPVNTVLPVISGTTQVGSTLSTTTGTWTGSPTGYSYQWLRGGANISGATSSTYLLVSADNAAVITVTVTATNAGGSAGSTSTGVGPITTPVTYVTWDPATITNVTLSGGNLVATCATTGTSGDMGAHVVTTSGKTSGKYYYEDTLTIRQPGGNNGMGIGTTASTYTNMGNNATTGVEVFIQSGNIWANGANTGTSFGLRSNGDIFGIAVDLDNRKIWFRLAPSGNWNNAAIGSQNPAVGSQVGGITIPAGTMVPFNTFGGTGGFSGSQYTANFGQSAFSGAVPAGFTSGWPV